MKRRTARILVLPILAAICSCASSSSTPNQNNNSGSNNVGSNNVGGSVINGKVSPDAQGNNRDQPIATDTVTTP